MGGGGVVASISTEATSPGETYFRERHYITLKLKSGSHVKM